MAFLLVFIGGGLGSGCRYLISNLAVRWFGKGFTWGTLGVNLLGCFIIGVLFGLIQKNLIDREARLFLMTGFLGGLTTFSTFALESVNFFQQGYVSHGLSNLFLNNFLGLVLVLSGIWLGNRFS